MSSETPTLLSIMGYVKKLPTNALTFYGYTSWGYPALPGSLFTNNKVYCVGKGGKVCEPQNMLGWIGISAIFTS